jgi:hypothetical protein
MDILMGENIGAIYAQAGSIRIRAGTQRRDVPRAQILRRRIFSNSQPIDLRVV